MCKYCEPKHCTESGELAHGEEMIINDGIESDGDISACIWKDGVLNIETEVDDLYAAIHINYCPICGKKLQDKQ